MNHRETMLNQFIIVSTKKFRSVESGFTLVELMVTIAVLAIIVSIAAPNIESHLAKKRIDQTANAFVTAFQTAKSESLIRRKNVDVIISNSEPKTIKVQTVGTKSSTVVETFQISNSSTMVPKESAPTTYRIAPTGAVSKADNSALAADSYYEICDDRVSGESGKKIIVNAVGQVQIISSGVTCS